MPAFEPLRAFLESMVEPALQTRRADPLAEHKAKAVVGYINDLAERYARTTGRNDTHRVRNELAAECPDFALVRDVADGTKHWIVDRPNSRVHGADSTRVETYGTSPSIVVTMKDGTKRILMDAVENCMAMWKRKLA
jgi:hypothetical protein